MNTTRTAEHGSALVSVLGLLLVLTILVSAFVSWMNVEQRFAGDAYRRTAALYLAEAGMEKAIWYLAHQAPDDSPVGSWRPVNYDEALGAGRFVVEEINEGAPGVLNITVRGETSGAVRRIRRTVRIAPRALNFGLFGGALVFAGQARTYVVPSLDIREIGQRGGDLGALNQMWFDADVLLNSPSDVLPDVVLVGEASLMLGNEQWFYRDLAGLQIKAPGIHARALRHADVSMPSVDMNIYRTLARGNESNAALNKAVGERALDRVLSEKTDSHYTQEQFDRILSYLETRRREGTELSLAGLIFVDGTVRIEGALRIDSGALVVQGNIQVMERARLDVRHTATTAMLPGVLAVGDGGTIRLGQDAVLNADGLLMASVGLEVYKARLDVSGAVLAGQGFLNDGGLVMIRYDPNVLRVVGVSRTENVLLHPLSWQELP